MTSKACAAAAGALILGLTLALGAVAQNAPAAGGPGSLPGAGDPPRGRIGGHSSPADQAIAYRKAVLTVLSDNFGVIVVVVRGTKPYDVAAVSKAAGRVAFLATLVGDTVPEVSREGNTKAKPEIWTDKAGWDKAAMAMVDSTAALADLVKKDNTNSAAFKAAARNVGGTCKGCHDKYRAK